MQGGGTVSCAEEQANKKAQRQVLPTGMKKSWKSLDQAESNLSFPEHQPLSTYRHYDSVLRPLSRELFINFYEKIFGIRNFLQHTTVGLG